MALLAYSEVKVQPERQENLTGDVLNVKGQQ